MQPKIIHSCSSSMKGLAISCMPDVGDTIITAVPLQTCPDKDCERQVPRRSPVMWLRWSAKAHTVRPSDLVSSVMRSGSSLSETAHMSRSFPVERQERCNSAISLPAHLANTQQSDPAPGSTAGHNPSKHLPLQRNILVLVQIICSADSASLCGSNGLPSRPPASFTRTPLSTSFAKSKVFSFFDIPPQISTLPQSLLAGPACDE